MQATQSSTASPRNDSSRATLADQLLDLPYLSALSLATHDYRDLLRYAVAARQHAASPAHTPPEHKLPHSVRIPASTAPRRESSASC